MISLGPSLLSFATQMDFDPYLSVKAHIQRDLFTIAKFRQKNTILYIRQNDNRPCVQCILNMMCAYLSPLIYSTFTFVCCVCRFKSTLNLKFNLQIRNKFIANVLIIFFGKFKIQCLFRFSREIKTVSSII